MSFKKLFLFASVLFFSFSFIYASGRLDEKHTVRLKEIDVLIKRTEYDKALLLLERYVKENPEKFDSAQKRIAKIMQTRERYADRTYDQYQLYDNQKSEKDVGYSSRQIITLQNKYELYYPDAVVRRYNEEVLESLPLQEIWREGAELMAQSRFEEAARKFHEGIDLYTSDLGGAKYPEFITEPVLESVEELELSVEQFKGYVQRLDKAADAYIRAVENQNYSNAQNALSAARQEFSNYAKLRNSIFRVGVQFQKSYNDVLNLEEEIEKPLFFFYSRDLVMGRIIGTNLDANSGILAAFDAPWNNAMQRMKNASYSVTLSKTRGASQLNYSDIKNYAELCKSCNSFYNLLEQNDYAYKMQNYDSSMDYLLTLCEEYPEKLALISELDKKIAQLNQLPPLTLEEDSDKNFAQINFSIDSTQEMVQLQKQVEAKNQEEWFVSYEPNAHFFNKEEMPSKQKLNLAGTDIQDDFLSWEDFSNLYFEAGSNSVELASSQQKQMWVTIAGYFASLGTAIDSRYNGSINHAQELLNGIKDEKTSLVFSYPKQAIEELEKLSESVNSDRKILENAISVLDNGSEYSENSFSSEKDAIQKAFTVLDQVNSRSQAIIIEAQKNIRLAQRAQSEAETRVSQVKSALERENFELARNSLQKASEKYAESFSYQEDSELRAKIDSELAALGLEINNAENIIVVREVRALKDQARDAYYVSDFEKAETLLSRAKTRWAVTNTTEDTEIISLQALVSTALSMKTGRVIPPEAPLYKEMSQLLSLANQYYNKASKKIKKDRTEAEALLSQARDKIRELKSVYPLNQEANVLSLKIDKLIDPESFSAAFSNSYQRAKSAFEASGKRTLDQDNYSNLLDLAQIEPNYPGIQDLIYNVQIALGIRHRPVENTSLKKSEQLAQEARRLFNSAGNDRAKLARALAKTDEALSLNPNNKSVASLKDSIQIRLGATASPVLSAAEQSIYNQAVQAFRSGNIGRASDLIEQLNQSHPNSSQVKELKNQIDAML